MGRGLTLHEDTTPASVALDETLRAVAEEQPALFEEVRRTSPGEPHRQALLLAARRIAARRTGDDSLGYADVEDLRQDLVRVQESLAAAGAARQAYGGLQQLLWQVDTFGFHLAELEVRQHSSVHARALAELDSGAEPGEQTREVLETLRTVARIQRRFGPRACRRYVVSFTHSSDDIAAVYRLADIALAGEPVELDVVPLFETEEDLGRCVEVVDRSLALPQVRSRLAASGRRYEVMLGYSDSAKGVGPVSATFALDAAQAGLVDWARSRSVRLTLFHGRGGAVGRGGGPAHRAILGQAPGSLQGRLKVTEQGESVFARYGNPAVAVRHLEQVTGAAVRASTPPFIERALGSAERYRPLGTQLSSAARRAYLELVGTPGFAEWFATVTPVEELALLPLGSRPARRRTGPAGLDDLRAIPWVFSWSQARVNLPGWYGLGTALQAVDDVDLLREAWRNWPLFQVLVENAEMSLAKTDVRIMQRFLELGDRPDLTRAVLGEHERTRDAVCLVTEQEELLTDRPALGRAIQLRNPYLDALSYLALRALRTLREGSQPGNRPSVDHLLLLCVNGVAAGLQNTG